MFDLGLGAARKGKGPCKKWSKGRTRCMKRGKPAKSRTKSKHKKAVVPRVCRDGLKRDLKQHDRGTAMLRFNNCRSDISSGRRKRTAKLA